MSIGSSGLEDLRARLEETQKKLKEFGDIQKPDLKVHGPERCHIETRWKEYCKVAMQWMNLRQAYDLHQTYPTGQVEQSTASKP